MSMYAKLAKSAAEHLVRANELLPLPDNLPGELYRQRACYVSILENPGRYLRAMAGQPLPRQATLAEEIIANTVNAIELSSHRIRQADLSYLSYQVALLGPLQRVSDPEHLDPIRFGLYVKSDRGKSALLLPHRAGVETPNDQIATALREAGIDTRREDATMYRFEVNYFDA